MATSSLIALGIALVAVAGLIGGLFALNLSIGALETYFGKPKYTLLKSQKGGSALAFAFKWNSAKEPASLNYVKIRLFNPFGEPKQREVTRSFEPKTSSFVEDINMGSGYLEILSATNFDNARITFEVGSEKDGVVFTFEMYGKKFKALLAEAGSKDAIEADIAGSKIASKSPIEAPERTFIAEPMLAAERVQLAIPTNPAFEAYFKQFGSGSGGGAAAGAAGGGGSTAVQYAVSKVWIEPGCIVCNACQDIYPEVFDVQPDTCYIKPNAPLDDGLKIQEAAEACPVEVIKYTKAS